MESLKKSYATRKGNVTVDLARLVRTAKGGRHAVTPSRSASAEALLPSKHGRGSRGFRGQLREERRRSLNLRNHNDSKAPPPPPGAAQQRKMKKKQQQPQQQPQPPPQKRIAPTGLRATPGGTPGNKEGVDSVAWRSDPSRLFGYKLFGPHAKESFENLVRKVEIASGPNQSDPKGFGVVARVALKKGTLIMDPTTRFFTGHPPDRLEADDCIHVPSRRGSGWSHGPSRFRGTPVIATKALRLHSYGLDSHCR